MSTANAPRAQDSLTFDSIKSHSSSDYSCLSETFANIINGNPVTSPKTYDVINPATGKVIGKAPEATAEQLDEAVAAARKAFPAWKSKSWDERREVLRKTAELLEDEQFATHIARKIAIEMGKPISLASREVGMCTTWLKGTLDLSLEDETLIADTEQSIARIRYVPLGVTAGIIPWNFPLIMLIAKLVPALLTGNVLIIKPSPYAPLAVLTLAAKMQSFTPPGVLSVLSGGNELGTRITTHPGIDKVAFTGSIATGKKVLKSAVDTLKRVTLELGGNDPCIVLPDVDISKAAQGAALASFLNSGQTCSAAKRIYVHEKIYSQFLEAFVAAIKTFKVGDPMDPATMIGPVCNAYQYGIVREFFDDCKANGYKFAVGGEMDSSLPGYFFPLSVVENPPESSKIVKEEPFGPIVPIMKWTEESDVIRRANDTKCGLGASIWGQDIAAVERIASQLEAGTIWINEAMTILIPNLPFGGHKESGIGTENGVEGLKHWCNIQAISRNKIVKL